MLKFNTSCAVLANLSSNLLNEVGLSLFRYFEVGLRVCDIVVKKFTFAISSPDEFLYLNCCTEGAVMLRRLRCTVVRTLVFERRTFPVPRSTCSWRMTTYVDKLSAIGQLTRPTQPFILPRSINWVVSYIGSVSYTHLTLPTIYSV